MRLPGLILLFLLWAGLAQARPVEVSIGLDGTKSAGGIWVTLAFDGDRDGRTIVYLPNRFGYASELWRNIKDVSVEGGRLVASAPSEWALDHTPGQRITIKYRVEGRSGFYPGLGVEIGPSLADDGIAFLGETVVAYPEGRLDTPAEVRLAPQPSSWALASDLQGLGRTTLRDIRESYLVAGPGVRLTERSLPDGSTLRIALRGGFSFTDADLADRAALIVAYQRRFWKAAPAPFLITLTEKQSRPGLNTWGGVGRGPDGAALYVSRDVSLAKVSEVLAHEPAHAWFARALGGLPYGLAEPEGYWFSEGFADYLAYRTLAQTGIMSAGDLQTMLFVRTWSEPAPLARIKTDYWSAPSLFDQPYIQGFHLAVIWDERLRQTGKGLGLREVLLAQAERAKSGGGPSADKLFPQTYKALSGLDIAPDIERFLSRGEPAKLPDKILRACGQFAEVEVPDQPGVMAMGDPAHCAEALFGSAI